MVNANVFFSCLIHLTLCSTISRAQPSHPPWHLQRIVQRDVLSEEQLRTGKPIFDLNTVPTKPVIIYVIDSGIQINHHEFGGRAEYGVNIKEPQNPPSDCNGHGTHVAALVGGRYSGVAQKTIIISVKVLDCEGRGTCADIVTALNWVAEHHRNRTATHAGENGAIVVMSIGSTSKSCAASQHASSILWKRGIVITAAAGNQKMNSCKVYPVRNNHTIGVGAVDNKDRAFHKNNYGSCVDIFAPGVSVVSAWGKSEKDNAIWKARSGTSMATPIVAGAAAIMLGSDPTLSSDDVKGILISSSTPNKVLKTNGNGPMIQSANRMLYAPWTRLFDAVGMNVPTATTRQNENKPEDENQIMNNNSDWNRSTSFGALSLTFTPRTTPAMLYSVTRIKTSISRSVGIAASSILGRRAAGVRRFSNGSEPNTVGLLFYIPMAKQLIKEYERRLIRADKTGSIQANTDEIIDLHGGSVHRALKLNVTVPEGWTNPLNEAGQSSLDTDKIVIIVVCALLSSTLVILAIAMVISRRRNARNEDSNSGETLEDEDEEQEPIGDENV